MGGKVTCFRSNSWWVAKLGVVIHIDLASKRTPCGSLTEKLPADETFVTP